MNFARALFFLLTVLFMSVYLVSLEANAYVATLISFMVATTIICIDLIFKRFALKSFTLTLLGLFFGYLLGFALSAIYARVMSVTDLGIAVALSNGIHLSLFLLGLYIGTMIIIRCGNELAISLPFLHLSPVVQKARDLLLDQTALEDPRILDLLNTGIFDHRLVLPRFLLRNMEEEGRHISDLIKRLDEHGMRYHETDFKEEKELSKKTRRLAKLLGADLLVSDTQVNAQEDGISIINIHALSNALKPLTPKGEFLKIKIQRIGKEEDQGVGYLEDGTMVVVNGGGLFIGETIDSRVLSVKHTSSGRMIFCNVIEDEVCYS